MLAIILLSILRPVLADLITENNPDNYLEIDNIFLNMFVMDSKCMFLCWISL